MKHASKGKFAALLGLVLISLGLLITLFLVKNGSVFNIGATPSVDPQDLRITNISDTSFSVTYTTSADALGTINFSNNSVSLDNVALDDRDQLSQTVNRYSVHSITVRDLDPDTDYFFQVNSGSKKYINGSSPFSVKTSKTINSEPTSQSPMTGKVLQEDGSPPPEAIVYVKINGAQDISVLTKSDGTYTIPLNSLLNQNLDDYFSIPPGSILSVEAKANSSSAKASVNPDGINPVPPLTLSNNYDFSSAQTSPTPQPQTQTFPNVGSKIAANVISVAPTQEPSTLPTQIPSITPKLNPTAEVLQSESAGEISPTPQPQPTIVATGIASAIMIPIFGSVLVVLGILMFLTTGRKIPL